MTQEAKGLGLLHSEITKIVSNVAMAGKESMQNPAGIQSGRSDGFRLNGKKTTLDSFNEKLGVLTHLQEFAKQEETKIIKRWREHAGRLLIPLSIGLDKDQKALETKYVEAKSLIGTLDYLAMSAMEGYGGAISEFYPHCFELLYENPASECFGTDKFSLLEPELKFSKRALENGHGFFIKIARRATMMSKSTRKRKQEAMEPIDEQEMRSVAFVGVPMLSTVMAKEVEILSKNQNLAKRREEELEEKQGRRQTNSYEDGRMAPEEESMPFKHYSMTGGDSGDEEYEEQEEPFQCLRSKYLPRGLNYKEQMVYSPEVEDYENYFRRKDWILEEAETDVKDLDVQGEEKEEALLKSARLRINYSKSLPLPITLTVMSSCSFVEVMNRIVTFLDHESATSAAQKKMHNALPFLEDSLIGKDFLKNPGVQLVFLLQRSAHSEPLELWDGTRAHLLSIAMSAYKAVAKRMTKDIECPFMKAWILASIPDVLSLAEETHEKIQLRSIECVLARRFQRRNHCDTK
jgi:hypothetical protein